MRRTILASTPALLVALLLASCGDDPMPAPAAGNNTQGDDTGADADAGGQDTTPDAPGEDAEPDPDEDGGEDGGEDTAPDAPDPDLATLWSATSGELKLGAFATSAVCAKCHSNVDPNPAMRDAAGRPVAPFDLWRSSMMANSARDPLWRAVVAAEQAWTPNAAAAIETKCLSCHAPMASRDAAPGGTFTLEALRAEGDPGALGADGVSCTVCHQIEPDNLGAPESFTGGFALNIRKRIYGLYSEHFVNPMERESGFTPVQGRHIRAAALCGTCHTLQTPTLLADGSGTGEVFTEQATYLEWRNSVFNDEGANPGAQARPCAGCHTPEADQDGAAIATTVARREDGGDFPIATRSPYGRLLFVGGNTLIPAILRDNREALNVPAPAAAFDATIARTTEQLQQQTAALTITGAARDGDAATFTVTVRSLVGHKLPTGFPSRRLWLRVRVLDGGGQTLFESGGFNAAGVLVDANGTPLPAELPGGPTLPHPTDTLTDASQVLVWEAIMADSQGAPTWSLLRAASFLKDNRILPPGWSDAHPDLALMRPQGVEGDADFGPGVDQATFRVQAPGAARVVVDLFYQPLGARFAAELFTADVAEVRAFKRLYEAADRTPVRVAGAEVNL